MISPTTSEAAAIDAGQRVALPETLAFEAAGGCQWVVIAFSSHPFAVSDLGVAVAGVARDVDSCALAPLDGAFAPARSIPHYLIRR